MLPSSFRRAARTCGLVELGVHIARGYDPLHIVVGSEEKLPVVCLRGFLAPQEVRMFQENYARFAGDQATRSFDGRGDVPVYLRVNLGSQGQRVGLARVQNAHGRSRGLRCAELNPRSGCGVSALAIENQVPRLELDRAP